MRVNEREGIGRGLRSAVHTKTAQTHAVRNVPANAKGKTMAGSPIKRAKLENLDAQEEVIFAYLEDGRTLADIATQVQCSRQFLARWLDYTEERSTRYAKARTRAADALADDAMQSADNVLQRAIDGKASKIELGAVKLSGDMKRWLAGKWNSAKYGESTGTQVNIDLGSMFLNAMRGHQRTTVHQITPVETHSEIEQVTPVEAPTPALPSVRVVEDVLGHLANAAESAPVVKRALPDFSND